MPSLGEAKSLGGVGALLVLIGGLTGTPGAVIAIIGFILILIATKYIADFTDDAVYTNMIIAVIFSIIGLVIFSIVVLSAFYSFVGLSRIGSLTPGTAPTGDFIGLIASIIIGLAVGWVFFLVASIFLKKSYDLIATRLNVGIFHTTGLLYLIGAALTIVFGIGLIIVFVAEILQIVAFFSIPEHMPAGPQPMPGQRGPPPAPHYDVADRTAVNSAST